MVSQIIQLGDIHLCLAQNVFLKGEEFMNPNPHGVSHRFTRSEEVALGVVIRVSFNTQSHTSDIPDISTRTEISQYTTSLQDQSKTPDIPFLSLCRSLCTSTEGLLDSFNVQVQDPKIGSHHHPLSAKFSQVFLYVFPPNPVKCHLTFHPVFIRYQFKPIKVIHEVSHPSSAPSIRVSRQRSLTPQSLSEIHLIRAYVAPRFTFVVYGLELLVIVWFGSIVLTLVVSSLFGCFSSPIVAVPLYISFLYVSFA